MKPPTKKWRLFVGDGKFYLYVHHKQKSYSIQNFNVLYQCLKFISTAQHKITIERAQHMLLFLIQVIISRSHVSLIIAGSFQLLAGTCSINSGPFKNPHIFGENYTRQKVQTGPKYRPKMVVKPSTRSILFIFLAYLINNNEVYSVQVIINTF